ncbi:MAG: hypothetical protein ACXVRK_03285 [Gaiellaceae bacterium]
MCLPPNGQTRSREIVLVLREPGDEPGEPLEAQRALTPPGVLQSNDLGCTLGPVVISGAAIP